jgi:hypothetical protein
MQVYAHALDGDDATAAETPPPPSSATDEHPPTPRPTSGNAVSGPAWCQDGVTDVETPPLGKRRRTGETALHGVLHPFSYQVREGGLEPP